MAGCEVLHAPRVSLVIGCFRTIVIVALSDNGFGDFPRSPLFQLLRLAHPGALFASLFSKNKLYRRLFPLLDFWAMRLNRGGIACLLEVV